MTEDDLIAAIDSYDQSAISTRSSSLSDERADALRYYNMEPYGDEVDTQSKVVTSEVFDAVESAATMLVKIFTSTDKAVEFVPENAEDVPAAEQKTKYANYVFYRENNGFLTIYSAIKDGLIMKNGVIKVWPKTNRAVEYKKFEGLTEIQALALVAEGHEILSAAERQDFDGAMLYDLETRYTTNDVQIVVKAIPPEELSVSGWHDSVLLEDCDYIQHRCRMSVSELREMGLVGPDEDLSGTSGSGFDEEDFSEETFARDEEIDDQRFFREQSPNQKSMTRVTVRDITARIDWDGDGIAERRRIIRIGNSIRYNEPTDYCCYGVFAPIVMPHRFIGKGYSDLMMQWQRVQSALLRQALNNIYLANHMRPIIKTTGSAPLVDIKSLMTAGPGEPIYEKETGALRFEAPGFVATDILGVSEIVRQAGEVRTGITRISQGINPDAITKTAAGASILTENANDRIEMLARVFAETCLKPVFGAIAKLAMQYQNRKKLIRIYNKFEEVDPSTWSEHTDMSINVGLGSGTARQTTANMADMLERQGAVVAAGGLGTLVTPKNLFAALSKYVETLGFKDPSVFFTDPETVEPAPPQPSAEEKLLQAQVEIERMKAMIAKTKLGLDAQAAEQQRDADLAKTVIDARTRVEVAKINAKSKLTTDRIDFVAKTGHDILSGVPRETPAERRITGSFGGAPMEVVVRDGVAIGTIGGESFEVALGGPEGPVPGPEGP